MWNKIKTFFKNIFFKHKNEDIQFPSEDQIKFIIYKFDLTQSMLEQVLINPTMQMKVQDFITNVICIFMKRYFSNDPMRALVFVPQFELIKYVEDCYQHQLNKKKNRDIKNLNVIAKNQIICLILSIISNMINGNTDQEEQIENEDD